MRRTVAVLGLVSVLVAGCGGGSPPVEPGGSALSGALGRVDAPFAGYVAFTDRAALPDAPSWTVLGDSAAGVRSAEDLGVDQAAADTVLVVGQPPRKVTLLVGGQDEQRIRTAATARGWTGSDVLRKPLDLREPLTLPAGTLRPLGADLAFGGPTAPVEVVTDGGGALAADPVVLGMADCLGDVVVALLVGGELGAPRAVGVRPSADSGSVAAEAGDAPGGPAAESVFCATGTSAAAVRDAVASGASARSGRPWAEYLTEPRVDELPGGVVRLVARNAPGTPAGFALAAMTSRDLPGVPAR